MARIGKQTRYWGVAVLSVVWVLLMMLLNAEAGSPGGNAITALWLLVAYWALLGNVQAIQTTSKYVLILQVVVGTIIFISLQNNSNMQLYFGSPDIFLLGISIPTIAWGILYWWASTKIATSNIEEKGGESPSISPKHMPYDSINSDMIKHNTNVATLTDPTASKRLENEKPTPESKIMAEKIINPNELSRSTTSNRELEFPRALRVIEYSEDASQAWEQVNDLPLEYQIKFLDALEKNPSQEVEILVSEINEARTREIRPYDDELANDALEESRTISPEAAAEFHEVYHLLQNKFSAFEILRKIESKYGPSKKTLREIELAKREAERLEGERLEAEQLEMERKAAKRVREAFLETQRLEAEQLELERQEAERAQTARIERERLEAEQLENQRREAERAKRDRLEHKRLEAEQLQLKRQKSKVLKQEKREAWLSLLNTMGRPVNLTMITLLVLFIISLQV